MAAVFFLTVMAHQPRANQDGLELAVKATYLVKFPQFVQWPAETFGGETDPMIICTVGGNPFGELLDQAVRHQRIGQREFHVRHLEVVTDDIDCHLIYIGEPDVTAVATAMALLRWSPVLTFTDEAIQPDVKGVIHLLVRDNRVRFEIDDSAAQRHGLEISSKVLGLALNVRPRS